jgi:DNA-binding CsgD family transcriptional regulator/tetratricopeptide (TPR) repeat protein
MAERLALAEAATSWPRQGVSGRAQALVAWAAGCVELAVGNRRRAEDWWRQVRQLADQTHVPTATLFVAQQAAVLALIDGRLEDALALRERYVAAADESGASVRARIQSNYALFSLAIYLGRPQLFLVAMEELQNRLSEDRHGLGRSVDPAWRAIFAACVVQLGRVSEATDAIGPVLETEAAASTEDDRPIERLTPLLLAAISVGHKEAAHALAARLSSLAYLATGDWFHFCPARLLGEAAAINGDWKSARAYYAQALVSAGKISFRPEIALTHVRLGELEIEEGHSSAALEHLDLAVPELRAMNMRPALEHAVSLIEGVRIRAPAESGTRPISDDLTARENEVAGLLALGRSNREIAEALVITEGTTEVHVKRILNKLGLKSRAEVAAWAVEHAHTHVTDKLA